LRIFWRKKTHQSYVRNIALIACSLKIIHDLSKKFIIFINATIYLILINFIFLKAVRANYYILTPTFWPRTVKIFLLIQNGVLDLMLVKTRDDYFWVSFDHFKTIIFFLPMFPWFNPRGAFFWPMLPNQACQGSLSCMSTIL